jgi:hypothetical protein
VTAIVASSLATIPGPAAAEDRSGPCDLHREADELVRRFSRRLIRCAATRWPVRGGIEKAVCIARRESALNPKATSEHGHYLGLYQHDAEAWDGRFGAWTRERWELNPEALNGRSNAIVTIRMASANGWGPWRGDGCTAEDLAG